MRIPKFLVMITMLLALLPNSAEEVIQGPAVYKDNPYGFTLKVPKGWYLRPVPGDFKSFSGESSSQTEIRGIINLYVKQDQTTRDLQAKMDADAQQLARAFPKTRAEILEEGFLAGSKQRAYFRMTKFTTPEGKVAGTVYVTARLNKQALLEFNITAEGKDWQKVLKEARAMGTSLKLP